MNTPTQLVIVDQEFDHDDVVKIRFLLSDLPALTDQPLEIPKPCER